MTSWPRLNTPQLRRACRVEVVVCEVDSGVIATEPRRPSAGQPHAAIGLNRGGGEGKPTRLPVWGGTSWASPRGYRVEPRWRGERKPTRLCRPAAAPAGSHAAIMSDAVAGRAGRAQRAIGRIAAAGQGGSSRAIGSTRRNGAASPRGHHVGPQGARGGGAPSGTAAAGRAGQGAPRLSGRTAVAGRGRARTRLSADGGFGRSGDTAARRTRLSGRPRQRGEAGKARGYRVEPRRRARASPRGYRSGRHERGKPTAIESNRGGAAARAHAAIMSTAVASSAGKPTRLSG